MPEPHAKDIVKLIDHVPHVWVREPDPDGTVRRGGHWQPATSFSPPEQEQRNSEVVKTALTLAGATAGGMGAAALLPEAATAIGASRVLPIATRLLGSTFGGAATRMGIHIPEALRERTTGVPSGTTFPREGTIGGAEGFANEAWPTFLEPVTSTAGTVLKFLGKAGLDKLGEGYTSRVHAAWLRGLAARMAGLGGVGDAVAALGPIAATEGGQALETVAPKLGTRTFSERAEGGLDWLKKKLFTRDLTHPELLEQGADEIARRKAAPWRVPEPFPKPGRTGGDPHVNPFGFTSDAPASAMPPREPLAIDRLAGERPPGDYTRPEWHRGGPAPGPPTGPRVNTAPSREPLPYEQSPENPLGREPDAPIPDVAVTPRAFTGNPEGVVPDVTVNPTPLNIGLSIPSELDPATGKYVLSPSPAGRTNPGAGAVDTMITKLNETQTARAAGHPVDLTPDELVEHYGTPRANTPVPRTSMTTEELDAAFDQMKAQNAARAADRARKLGAVVLPAATAGALSQYERPQSASSIGALMSRTGYAPQSRDEAAAATDVFDVGLPNSALDALIRKSQSW